MIIYKYFKFGCHRPFGGNIRKISQLGTLNCVNENKSLLLFFLGFPQTLEILVDGLITSKRLFSPPKRPDRLWGPPTLKDKRAFYLPSLKRPGREVKHSQIYRVPKLRVSDLYISAHSVCLHGMDSNFRLDCLYS